MRFDEYSYGSIAGVYDVVAAVYSRGTTLALRDDDRKRSFGSIGYDGDRAVRRITDRVDLGGEHGSGLFAGVHLMNPDVFEWMPEREEFEILTDVYTPALERGERIHCWLQPQDCEWSPVGDPAELLAANLGALGAIARESGKIKRPLSAKRGHSAKEILTESIS